MTTKQATKAKSDVPPISPLRVGEAVFIRTVTMYYTGRVVGFDATEVLLEDAAWIADTGRFASALATGTLNEVEPFPDGVISVSRGAVLDISTWKHPLPRTAK